MNRYIGEPVMIHPKYETSDLIWITREYSNNQGVYSPSFWFSYDNWLYYGVVDYNMDLFEDYLDWVISDGDDNDIMFDLYSPGKIEFDLLIDFKVPSNIIRPYSKCETIYYKVDFIKIMNEDNLDEFCQYEIDFIKQFNRDIKINNILS